MKRYIFLIIPLSLYFNYALCQKADTALGKGLEKILNKSSLIGYVFSGFYHGFNENSKPRTAFEVKSVLLGYKFQATDKIKVSIATDISKATTVMVTDSSGRAMGVKYYEDTRYLLWLKQAEISWEVTPFLEFNFGCMILDQYISLQDGFWGHRYVDVTFQESNLYGIPSDLGARVKFRIRKLAEFDFAVLNGEGAKRYQDINGKFLYAGNFMFFPVKHLFLKVYADIEPTGKPDEKDRYTLVGFAGFKNNTLMAGVEYAKVFNFENLAETTFSGASFYSSYSFLNKYEVFARCDMLIEPLLKFYIIGGFQYQPVKNLKISLNYRHTTRDNIRKIYLNAGYFL